MATLAGEAFIALVLGCVGSCCWPGHVSVGGSNGRFSVTQIRFVVGPLVTVTVLLYCEGGRVMETISPSSTQKSGVRNRKETKLKKNKTNAYEGCLFQMAWQPRTRKTPSRLKIEFTLGHITRGVMTYDI